MNELLWFLMLFLDFGALLLLYRYLGKTGVFIWIPIATILANIQVLKIVQLFGFTATLGNIAYASLFLATDILSENHSRKDAHLAVLVGFLTMLLTILIMTLALAFEPAPSDFVQSSMKV
ncbi:MAG: queuosine precursor transporter, partial [Lentisphaerae bacterium]|nr:queuosine precursor transporter [Lentisphaerota bacterium]